MTINSAWCPVVHARVTTMTTLEGEVTNVICPEFDRPSKSCRVKKTGTLGGPLSQLLERVADESLGEPDARCDLA
jgi:hypothetical protein